MADLQTINVGSFPNDGTGDDIRASFKKTNAAIEIVNAHSVSISEALDAVANQAVNFDTLAQADAAIDSFVEGAGINVNNDGNNNGFYVKQSSAWVKKSVLTLPVVSQAVNDVNDKFVSAQTLGISLKAIEVDDEEIVPIVYDPSGKVALGFDAEGYAHTNTVEHRELDGEISASVLQGQSFVQVQSTGDIIPFIWGANGGLILGVNRVTGKVEGAILDKEDAGGVSGDPDALPPRDRPGDVQYRGMIHYGQSLSLGHLSKPALSTSALYSTLTFAQGPRSTKSGSVGDLPGQGSLIPLIENNLTGEGGDCGESPCFGAANTTVQLLAVEAGVPTEDTVIVASAAGHGSYSITNLDKGSAWYQSLIDHVTSQKALAVAASKTYECTAVTWVQGESNVTGDTPRQEYLDALLQLRIDIETDIRDITGQVTPVWLIMYQTAYRIVVSANIALAQMDALAEDPYILFSGPIYHLPHAADDLHLTNIGSRWIGAMQGKVLAQLLRNRRPRRLRPVSVTTFDGTATVLFDVPVAPLVFDTVNLPDTVDSGFVWADETGALTISGIAIDPRGDRVNFEFSRAVDGVATVRYALDNAGIGLEINGGASGNLRDSDPTVSRLGGVTIPLWNPCPAFEATAINLG